MNRENSRLLFRKSDKVLLEFKCDEDEILPTRGVRLDEGNIADFCYSIDSKYIYLITDDGILHFRSKNLDKDYVVDKSRHFLIVEGQYFSLAISHCGRYLACSSNFSEGSVTEHSIHMFELQGTKDPLFIHKITFITDYPQDWLKNLNFDAESRSESVLAGCTAASCMLLTFVLRDRKLEQFEKEFSFEDSPDGKLFLIQANSVAWLPRVTLSGSAPPRTKSTESRLSNCNCWNLI